jgi:hypothetical protein
MTSATATETLGNYPNNPSRKDDTPSTQKPHDTARFFQQGVAIGQFGELLQTLLVGLL